MCMKGAGHACRYGASFLGGFWYGSNGLLAAVHRVDLMTKGPRALSQPLHGLWMHHVSLTSSPLVLYFRCSFPSPGRLGPARAEVGLGFAVVGWFRCFRPSRPPLVWFRFRRPPFFLPLPFQGLPVLGQVCCVGVLSFPLLLRSPLRVLVK